MRVARRAGMQLAATPTINTNGTNKNTNGSEGDTP